MLGNAWQLGEVAVPECSIELQNLKIRTICQTKNKTAFLPILCYAFALFFSVDFQQVRNYFKNK